MADTKVAEPVLRTCVVCGAQSHRDDWINKVRDDVACDGHSKTEIAKALSARTKQTEPVKLGTSQAAPSPDPQDTNPGPPAAGTVTVK